MLEPREADIPVLFLVLVVLPVVTYILLGKWNEAAKNKARISMLAQLAAEEALRVEAMTSADVFPTMPSPTPAVFECARCFGPATTRCSRCKSVRYCSGKCQIIHWRQGHKQECQQWDNNTSNLSSDRASFTESVQLRTLLDENSKSPFVGKDIDETLHSDIPPDLSSDPSIASATIATNTTQVSAMGIKLLDKQFSHKFKREIVKSDDRAARSFVETISCDSATPTSNASTLFTELSSKESLSRHKSGNENFTAHDEVHRNQDTSSPTVTHVPTVPGNCMHQSCKSAGKARDIIKSSIPAGISTSLLSDKNVINDCETGIEFTSEKIKFPEGGFSSASETLELSSAEKSSMMGSTKVKKPPYTLGPTNSLSQKLAEKFSRDYPHSGLERNAYTENESRISQTSISTATPVQGCNGFLNIGGMKMAGLRKAPKVPKRSLVGIMSDLKKNKVLFPYEDLVKFFQCEVWDISTRGLLNCGNSCYANAVLQCLTCTKPLVVYLLRRSHSKTCWVRDWCLMCELEQHVLTLREGGAPLSPSRILSNMRNIGCRIGGGNQEDAHEFLRFLVMSMQSICLEGLGGEKEVDSRLQETTLIQQIFGGRIRSKVKCLRCHLESERYENIMDLTLEIHGWVESLEDALTQFTAPEDLDGENMYRCGRCSAYVKAIKQLSVHEVPNILTIVLKRFQTGEYGKINKCITFPEMLDMIPYMTGTADSPPLYMLYAVVVHLDTLNASFYGHYVSYVKDLQGTWFRIDDSEVHAVPLSQVMSEGAYMLFYSRSFPRPPRTYNEKPSLHDRTPTKHATSKVQKFSRHGQSKPSETLFVSDTSLNVGNGFRPENREGTNDQTADYILQSRSKNLWPTKETFADSVSMDFSDTTSSDWSLFTSSDESSFTTESTRDSFSTVDYGDTANLDTISSIFSPFYIPEYSHSSNISCTKFSPCGPQTRFVSESKGFVLDSSMPTQELGSVYKGRNPELVSVSLTQPLASSSKGSIYGRCGSNPKDSFVRTYGYSDL